MNSNPKLTYAIAAILSGSSIGLSHAAPAPDASESEGIQEITVTAHTNPFGVLNTSPAYSPPAQFNLRTRYDTTIGEYQPFVSVGANHVGTMRNEPASYPNGNSPTQSPPTSTVDLYTMPGYTTYDAAIGVGKDNWTAQVTGNNLTNSNASTNTNSGQFIKSEVPLRPRVLTLTVGYKF